LKEKVHNPIDKKNFSAFQRSSTPTPPEKTKCDFCELYVHNILKHLFRAHNPKNLFGCEYCEKKFKKKIRQAQHIVEFHGYIVDSYKDKIKDCPHCERKFLLSNNFKRHLEGHALKIRPRKCKFCKQEFPSLNAVVDHQVAAHGRHCFTCAKCNKKFIAASDLRMHARSHSTVAPYICHHCGKTFRRRQDIMNHMATHMHKTFVRCKVCNTGCRDEGTLRSHMENYHSENFNLENLLPKPKRRPKNKSQDFTQAKTAPTAEPPQNAVQQYNPPQYNYPPQLRATVQPQMPASQPHNVQYWPQLHPGQPIMASMPRTVTNQSTTNHPLPFTTYLSNFDNLSANPFAHIPRINLFQPRPTSYGYQGTHDDQHAPNACALQTV
jgi:Zinc finger, C2H2 type/Zinc-finger of C2H2 type